jgi:hypothetical protein
MSSKKLKLTLEKVILGINSLSELGGSSFPDVPVFVIRQQGKISISSQQAPS